MQTHDEILFSIAADISSGLIQAVNYSEPRDAYVEIVEEVVGESATPAEIAAALKRDVRKFRDAIANFHELDELDMDSMRIILLNARANCFGSRYD